MRRLFEDTSYRTKRYVIVQTKTMNWIYKRSRIYRALTRNYCIIIQKPTAGISNEDFTSWLEERFKNRGVRFKKPDKPCANPNFVLYLVSRYDKADVDKIMAKDYYETYDLTPEEVRYLDCELNKFMTTIRLEGGFVFLDDVNIYNAHN